MTENFPVQSVNRAAVERPCLERTLRFPRWNQHSTDFLLFPGAAEHSRQDWGPILRPGESRLSLGTLHAVSPSGDLTDLDLPQEQQVLAGAMLMDCPLVVLGRDPGCLRSLG